MTDDGTQLVTHASGVGLYERRGQLLVVDRGVGWIYTANFVVGLLTFIFSANASEVLGQHPRRMTFQSLEHTIGQ